MADVVGDIVRVTVAWDFPDDQIIMNNLSYQCSTSGGSDTRAGLGAAVGTIFTTQYLPRLAPQVTFFGYKVAYLNRSPAPVPYTSIGGAAGTGTAPNAPSQARPLLRLRSAFAGRKYRGRLFLPAPQSSDVGVSGYPGSGLVTAITALGTALLPAISTAGSTWVLGIAHLVKKAPLSTTFTPVTAIQAPALFGTQWKSGNTGRPNSNPW